MFHVKHKGVKPLKKQKNDINNPTLHAKYQRGLQQFRKNHIPERFNQVKLLDELNNKEIDHFISISNRTDGKSFNYIHALLKIAIEYDIGLSFYSRSMMLRVSYQQLIEEIIEVSDIFDRMDFNFIRQHDYVTLTYNDKTIALITDLNRAQDLKNYSNYLKKFPIMIYDEFLALESDYLSDEWERLKTIYQSIDRVKEYPLIYKPKIFYLGNAVNFESPVLHGLKIFNILENHPINTAKVYKDEFNIMLEINRNDNANEERNTRAFGSENDAMSTAQFETNDYNIATDNDRMKVKQNPRTIMIKLKKDYLHVWFNPDDYTIILSIKSNVQEPYQYNLQLKDNKEQSEYLNEKYFDEKHIKKIDKGMYLFDNNYSKNYITNDFHGLNKLKINKIIREFLRHDNDQLEQESKEKQFQQNYIDETKKELMRKIWGD